MGRLRKARFCTGRLLIILAVLLIIIFAILAAIYFFVYRYIFYQPDLPQVEPPDGAQLLIFPIDSGFISTGYRNPVYFEIMGFPHFGLDVTPVGGARADVLASGEGVVLGTEFRTGSLGYIAVIRYDDVFIPETGEVICLIARYYHMASLVVGEGEVLYQGQVIGSIDGRHEYYTHIHIELDANIGQPFHTPQVAEASSDMLYRQGATGEQMINPLYVLAVGAGQQIFLHPNARFATENDHPRFAQEHRPQRGRFFREWPNMLMSR